MTTPDGSMSNWNRFPHLGIHHHLHAIAEAVTPHGVRLGSVADGEITLQWPDGETVFVRRYRKGPYRWRLATTRDRQEMFLSERDPSLAELKTAIRDPEG